LKLDIVYLPSASKQPTVCLTQINDGVVLLDSS